MIQDVKETYTTSEWKNRESYYIKVFSTIIIPLEPSTKDIMRLEAQVDALFAEVLLELAYIKRKNNEYKTAMTLAEKELFVVIKKNNIATTSASKITEKEVTGLVIQHLKNNPLNNQKNSIYTLLQNSDYRLAFIESIAKILQEKKAALVTLGSMIKIETTISV